MYELTKEQKETIGVRARERAAQRNWRVEGEMLSLKEIGERLGVSEGKASERMKQLRNASGAITWQRLRDLGR